MNKVFASLTAAVIVSLGTSLAAAQASAVVLAPEVRARHVVTPNVAPLVGVPVVRPRVRAGVTVNTPLVGVPVVRPRPRAGVTVNAPLVGVPVARPRARGVTGIRR